LTSPYRPFLAFYLKSNLRQECKQNIFEKLWIFPKAKSYSIKILLAPYPNHPANLTEDRQQKGDALITEFEEIPEEYFKKRKDSGLALGIRATPPPSKQLWLLNIARFPQMIGAVLESQSSIDLHSVNKISNTMKNQMSLLITSVGRLCSFNTRRACEYVHIQRILKATRAKEKTHSL